jgi:hypothetical protein
VFAKVGSISEKEVAKARDEGRTPQPAATWKSENANSNPFFKATIPEYPWTDKDALYKQVLDVDLPVGRRFRAMVKPNAKGFPALSEYMPPKEKKAKKAKAAPVVDLDELEDDELYDSEA